MSVKLYDVLKTNGKDKKSQEEKLKNYGYTRDNQLSNHNQQVYHNAKDNKLLYNVRGTHNLKDIGTDIYLALGGLKKTDRYKEADNVLKKAQEKYKNSKTHIIGESLGGAIAQGLHNRGKTTTYNSGYTIGQKTRGEHIRASGDVVSLLGANARRTTTIKKPLLLDHKNKILGSKAGITGFGIGTVKDALASHSSEQLKDTHIYI